MYTMLIDTHSSKIIIVIYKEGKVVVKKEAETIQNHSTEVMPILIEVLDSLSIEVNDINEILVVNGPGSFTGVRIGVTIAKTLAFTLKVPIKTLSSLLVKAVSFSHQTVRIVEPEKNGVFLGTFDEKNNLIGEYTYVKNSAYEPKEEDVKEVELDYEAILEFSNNLERINPHAVNPLYVKKIEVQK